jgi:hypothetical protein
MDEEDSKEADTALAKQCTCGGVRLNTWCATWCAIFGPLKCHEEVGMMHRICGSENVVAHVDNRRDGRGKPVCQAHRDELQKHGYKFRELG